MSAFAARRGLHDRESATHWFIRTKDNIADIMTKVLPSHTHKYLCNQLLYTLTDKGIAHFDGTPVNGEYPMVKCDKLVMPDLRRYYAAEPSEISGFESEEAMPNKFGKSTTTIDTSANSGHMLFYKSEVDVADCAKRLFRRAALRSLATIGVMAGAREL